MTVNVDPCVSLMISKFRNATNVSQKEVMLCELKKLCSSPKIDNYSLKFEVWKKLYLLYHGLPLNPIDFVNAATNAELFIKRMGYQGLQCYQRSKHCILMIQTVLKDMDNDKNHNEALIFLGNFNDRYHVLQDCYIKCKIMPENSKLHCKSLVVKSKNNETIPFLIQSSKDSSLYTKLQIIIDRDCINFLKENDMIYLKSKLLDLKCDFTKLKILQIFIKKCENGYTEIDVEIINVLKTMISLPKKKTKKQIELALALESAKLLITTKNICENLEEFIYRLISSENINSRFLGFKIISKYSIIPEIAINRIFELGIHENVNADTLCNLICKENAEIIYEKIIESSYNGISNRKDLYNYEHNLTKCLLKICKVCNEKLYVKVLFEYPQIYHMTKNNIVLSKESTKKILDLIIGSTDIRYFSIIYSLFISKPKYIDKIPSICSAHLKILQEGYLLSDLNALDELIDFLSAFGDVYSNRELFRSHITDTLFQNSKDIYLIMVERLLRFNIVLNNKIIHIRDNILVEFILEDNSCTLEYEPLADGTYIFEMNPVSEFKYNKKTILTYKWNTKSERAIIIFNQRLNFFKEICMDFKQ